MKGFAQLLLLAALVAGCAPGAPQAASHQVLTGQVPLDGRGPDGNSVVFDAPDGLIVVDTGRHPQAAQAILDLAHRRGRPIAAIVNTHWHLDHTTGNADLRRAFPSVPIYATLAIDGALKDFLNRNRADAEAAIADPATPADRRAELVRGRSVVDHPDSLLPTHPVTRSQTLAIAGRTFQVKVAPFAATEADLWLYDPVERLAVVGDLVVGLVPFMDTACVEGWQRALGEIAETPFQTLVPGHGVPMDRATFLTWKAAFDAFVACGRSDRPGKECVAGWERGAAPFIDDDHRAYVRAAAAYYLDTRLRAAPAEQQRYCRPMG